MKSWLLLALFFCPLGVAISSSAISSSLGQTLAQANQQQLHNLPQWQALLHLKSGVPQITDKNFILSYRKFSLQAEVTKTIELFYTDPSSAICRFPARLLFFNKHLKRLNVDLTKTDQCPELKKYTDYVPFDNIELIFASEVLSSAASMMGHSFLKVSGKNLKSNEVSHSISFFTEFNTLNPFSLIYDGLFGGMQGFFIVRPYGIDLEKYGHQEGRNLWSYQLKINDFDKQLIKYHIWELKNLDIEYLFQSYNCATLTLYILSIAEPELKNEEILYVSPIDVVKAVTKHQMIKQKSVILAPDWELNMLAQEIDNSLITRIEAMVFEDKLFNFEQLDQPTSLLAKKYLSLLLNNESVKQQVPQGKRLSLHKIVEQLDQNSLMIELTQYKNPVKSPQDSSIGVKLILGSPQDQLDLTFLPASHNLSDDNRQYFSESELKIAELTIRKNIDNSSVKLQRFILYSVKSLLPSRSSASQLSGSLFIGYHHILDQSLIEKGIAELNFSFGKTTKIHRDIMIYGMLGLGFATNIKHNFAYVEPYVGAIINVVGDGKVITEYRASYGQFSSNHIKQTLSLDYSYYGIDNYTINLEFKMTSLLDLYDEELSLGFSYHF